MLTNNEVYNEIEMINIPDASTLQHINCKTLFKLEDPYNFRMYNVPGAQMDGGANCTVTNNINLVKNLMV